MKKTFVQLLILIICFSISQQSFGQKVKPTKVDTFYFEAPAVTLKNSFKFKTNHTIDSLPLTTNRVIATGYSRSEETDFTLTRSIRLSDNSGSKTIPIEINKGSLEFLVSVNCNLKTGILNVEIYDPKGTKRGNFSVIGSDDKSGWSETVGGVINKRFPSPMEGPWILTFVAKKVTADIMIKTKVR